LRVYSIHLDLEIQYVKRCLARTEMGCVVIMMKIIWFQFGTWFLAPVNVEELRFYSGAFSFISLLALQDNMGKIRLLQAWREFTNGRTVLKCLISWDVTA